MRPENDYLGLPIRSLQSMLREISYCREGFPCPTPDGVFGEVTLEAVMRFQKEKGLPVTGVVDNDTWDAVVEAYWVAVPDNAPPRLLFPMRERDFTIRAGQCCIHMFLIQAMYQALSRVLDGVEPTPVTGEHAGPSVRNTVWLQRRSGLPETGIMEKHTWNMLTRAYDLFVARNFEEGLCSTAPIPPSGRSPNVREFPWEPYGPNAPCL